MRRSPTGLPPQALAVTPNGGTPRVSPCAPVVGSGEPLSLEAYERACVQRALEKCEGSALAAAEMLGIGKSTIYRHLRRLDLRRTEVEHAEVGLARAPAAATAEPSDASPTAP